MAKEYVVQHSETLVVAGGELIADSLYEALHMAVRRFDNAGLDVAYFEINTTVKERIPKEEAMIKLRTGNGSDPSDHPKISLGTM